MAGVSRTLRDAVVRRAGNRCEYCGLSQAGQIATLHVDHVWPRSAGGPTDAENLALARVSCSLRKAARTEAVDPETGEPTPIFDPRTQVWGDHFGWDGVYLVARSATGRATAAALALNRTISLAIRAEEMRLGRHPPRSS